MAMPSELVERELEKLTPGEKEALLWMSDEREWSRKSPRDRLLAGYPGDAMFMMWANNSPFIEGSGLTTGFARYRLTPLGVRARQALANGGEADG